MADLAEREPLLQLPWTACPAMMVSHAPHGVRILEVAFGVYDEAWSCSACGQVRAGAERGTRLTRVPFMAWPVDRSGSS